MLTRNHTLRIEAIRQGFDDRLPILVEYDPAGPTALHKLGPVLAPFGTHADCIAPDADEWLALLADAVYQRRIRCAA